MNGSQRNKVANLLFLNLFLTGGIQPAPLRNAQRKALSQGITEENLQEFAQYLVNQVHSAKVVAFRKAKARRRSKSTTRK